MTVTFGMIGASTIGVAALLEPASRSSNVHVRRVAARRHGAGEEYARRWGIPEASAHYEEVLEDPSIDAVYVANAAAEHARWSIAALAAGKHVLCEKPIAVSAEEAAAIVAAARDANRIVMEGFHYRFHPLFLELRALVESARFGRLQSINSVVNGARPYDPDSILHANSLGGGALLHNGVYAIHWTRTLFDAEPSTVRATQNLYPDGADSETHAQLGFAQGGVAELVCSFERDAPVSATLRFEGAEVVATGLIGAHHGHSLRIVPDDGAPEVRTVAGRASFDYQLDEFVQRVSTGRAPGGVGDDLIGNAAVVDEIRRAARGDDPR